MRPPLACCTRSAAVNARPVAQPWHSWPGRGHPAAGSPCISRTLCKRGLICPAQVAAQRCRPWNLAQRAAQWRATPAPASAVLLPGALVPHSWPSWPLLCRAACVPRAPHPLQRPAPAAEGDGDLLPPKEDLLEAARHARLHHARHRGRRAAWAATTAFRSLAGRE